MADSDREDLALRVQDVVKSFGGVHALRGVNFDLRSGEVHALVGENGAGKSTLMNVLGGIVQKDSGQVEFNGHVVHFATPAESQAAGIAIIHQELAMLRALSVMENIFMGRMPARRGWVDRKNRNQIRIYLKWQMPA